MATYSYDTSFTPIIEERLEGGMVFNFIPPLRSAERLTLEFIEKPTYVGDSYYIKLACRYKVAGADREQEIRFMTSSKEIYLPKNTEKMEFFLMVEENLTYNSFNEDSYNYFRKIDLRQAKILNPFNFKEHLKAKVKVVVKSNPNSESLEKWGNRELTIEGQWYGNGIAYLFPTYYPKGDIQWSRMRLRFPAFEQHFVDLSKLTAKQRLAIRQSQKFYNQPFKVSMLNLDGTLYKKEENNRLLNSKRSMLYQPEPGSNLYPEISHAGIWSHPLGESYLNVSYSSAGDVTGTSLADGYLGDTDLYINNHTGKKRQIIFNPTRMGDQEQDSSTVNLVFTPPTINHLDNIFNSFRHYSTNLPNTIVDEFFIGLDLANPPDETTKEKSDKTWLSLVKPKLVKKYLVQLAVTRNP